MEYICESYVFPLFPDAEEIMGKWMLWKVDSGSWCLNPTPLARMWMLGFIIYSGFPNTTRS